MLGQAARVLQHEGRRIGARDQCDQGLDQAAMRSLVMPTVTFDKGFC